MIRPVSLQNNPVTPQALRVMAPPGAVTDAYVGSTAPPEAAVPTAHPAEVRDVGQHAGRALKVAAAVGLALAGVGFLAGCTSTGAPPPPSSIVTEFYSTGDFKVEVVPEGYQRIDVVRGTHTEKVGEEEKTVPNDYAPFGVYLGDGLFYDTNSNLVLVPQRALEGPVAPAESLEVKVDPEGWSNTTRAVRNGDTVEIQRDGFGNDITIRQEGGRFTIDPEGWSNSTVITRDGNHTTVDPDGWSNEMELQRSQGLLTVDPDGWNNTTRVGIGQDRLELDPEGWSNSTVITRAGSTIRIDPEGWGNETTITRKGSEIRVHHPGLGGDTVIRQDGDRLVVDPVGWGNETVVEWKP